MPALAGFLARREKPRDQVVSDMLGVVPHRSGRVITAQRGAVCLGVLSSEAEGDMGSLAEDEGWLCAFVGVLDNASELTQRSGTDPAVVVLELFKVEGENCFNRLRGEFAIAISNGKTLWVARDHFGLETLFYRDEPGGLFVASEVKQVVKGSGITREPDLDVIDAILFAENDDETPAAVKGVQRLRKATILRADAGGFSRRQYWDPGSLLETSTFRGTELQERFDDLMRQAVRRSMVGPDIVMLSGGIDSPAIAGYGASIHFEAFGTPLNALSHIYPDFPLGNEQALIEQVVEELDIPADMYQPEPQGLEGLAHYVDLFDGPWSAWVPQMAEEAYARARSARFTNILSGEFAELVFEMREFLLSHLIQRGRLRAAREQLLAQRRSGERWPALTRRVVTAATPRFAAGLYYQYLHSMRVPGWVDEKRVRAHNRTLAEPMLQQWRNQQLAVINGPGLSAEASAICQAANGVRERMPWVDVDLFEFFISLKAEVKFPDNHPKSLVRQLLRGRVPDVILDRRQKVGMHDFFRATFDYPSLRKLLVKPSYRFKGIDYARLAERLEREDLDEGDYFWAKDLAYAHAFLGLW